MKIRHVMGFVLAMGIALAGSAQQRGMRGGPGRRGPQYPPLRMTVAGFPDGSVIPTRFTCVAKGNGESPAVHWTDVPPGTQSFILLVHDPEAHPGRGVMDVTHWMIWNIPGTAKGLPQGVPAGDTLPDGAHQVRRGNNPVGRYFGPCAPPGPNHHYTWDLYALDIKLDLPATATREEIMNAANGHILSAAEWIGLFHR
jgi:Raf kinase inhibitor-like YbhB/YbcL family protein